MKQHNSAPGIRSAAFQSPVQKVSHWFGAAFILQQVASSQAASFRGALFCCSPVLTSDHLSGGWNDKEETTGVRLRQRFPPPPPPGTSLAAWECSHPWLLRDILWGCLFVGLLALASPPVVRERLDGYPRLPGWAPLQLHLTRPPCFWGTETLCPGAHAHKKARTHAHRYTHRGTGKQREDRCSSSLLPRNFTLLHARNQPPFILSR